MVTGSRDGKLRVFEVVSGECLHALKCHTDWIRYVVQVDQDTFASAGDDKTFAFMEDISDGALREVAQADLYVDSMADVTLSTAALYSACALVGYVWHIGTDKLHSFLAMRSKGLVLLRLMSAHGARFALAADKTATV